MADTVHNCENIDPCVSESNKETSCARTHPCYDPTTKGWAKRERDNMTETQNQHEVEGVKEQYKAALVVLAEIKKSFAELQKNFNSNKENHDKLIKDMSNALMQKDRDLEQCQSELKCANEKMKSMEIDASVKMAASTLQCESPARTSNVSKADESTKNTPDNTVAKTVQTFMTPNAANRIGRKSFINGKNVAFNLSVNEMSQSNVSFKEIAIEQKEMLDCYALISGISITCNIKKTSSQNDKMPSSKQPVIYTCKVDCGSSLDGVQFQLSIDYEYDLFSYTPLLSTFPEAISETDQLVPGFMKEEIFFDSNQAPNLLKRILSCVNGSKDQL